MASERARERAVHRYYRSWLEFSAGHQSVREKSDPQSSHRFHLDGTRLQASNDKSLIAFAQLGCLRLQAKRGIVTLLATNEQYVLAEATKTTSLNHQRENHAPGDELWFGNASLPRSEGMSADALAPGSYLATGLDGAQHSAPALVVNDIAVDSRYSHHGYAGNGVNFYCGVPIITAAGLPIGVYTITDDKPRNGLTPEELRFMEDMANVVMDHLETVHNDSARFRGERLVLGLGHFVQGDSTLSQDQSFISSDRSGFKSPEMYSPSDELEQSALRFKGMNITDAELILPRHHNNHNRGDPGAENTTTALKPDAHGSANSVRDVGSDEKPKDESDPNATVFVLDNSNSADPANSSQPVEIEQVFSRAANILRECAEADGVVFYDAVSNNFAKGHGNSNYADAPDPIREPLTESASSDENTSTDKSFDHSDRSTSASSGFSDNGKPLHILSSRGKRSRVLGYSLDISSGSTASETTMRTLTLSEQSLRRFIRRYPQGKMFYFSENGDVSSESDQSTPSSHRGRPVERPPHVHSKDGKLPGTNMSIAAELIQVVPGARSVMWLPLWDYTKQRCSAGTFLWSRQPDRLLAAQEDLIYLRTFGSCIMGEISRLEAISSDTARTTFIANISHELRSPLHGILGSVEFLQDTPLDAFQSSMTTAVETCGRTLLDTVDHVLDYAKINNLSKRFSKRKAGRGQPQSESRRKTELAFECNFDLAVIIEEVIEAVYAGQTFRSAGKLDDTFAPATPEAAQSPEAARIHIQQGNTKFSGAVRIVLAIQKLDSWWVHGQPGAIRRIVMNIFGNSLKYTNKGTVKISLTSDIQTVKSRRLFCITVTDTGIGMSAKFLRSHAFNAFTQESHFSVGAGLGLNIVQQIVNSLGGKVEVSSQQGVGTEVKIWLSLPDAPRPAEANPDDMLSTVAQKTIGQTICLLNPEAEDHEKRKDTSQPSVMVESTLEELAKDWFGMRSMIAPTMKDVSADFFVYAEPPPIGYLLEHHGIHARKTEVPVIIIATNAFESSSLLAGGIHQLTDIGRVVEVTAQPCGPQKLARILHRAMLRIAQLARDPQSQQNTAPAGTDVIEDTRASEPYLGDSDSQQSIEPRLKRNHHDHPQPEESRPRTVDSTHRESKEQRPSARLQDAISLDIDNREFSADRPEPGSPLSPQPNSPSQPLMSRLSVLSTSSVGSNSGSNPSTPNPGAACILLVDDNDINLNLLVAFMKKAKLPYETAKDGLQALEAYKKAASGPRFTHVLMDISMPVMDGISSTREIRRFEKRENIPRASIVALTGQANEATQEEMFKAGGDQFVTKPVKFKELMKILERLE